MRFSDLNTSQKVLLMLANNISVPLVVSYDNAPNEFTHYFTKTLNRQEWDYTIIGEGDVWQGWQTRMKAYRDYLYTLPDDKIVVLSDARDVVCVRSPKAFMDAFQSFNKDIVACMELICAQTFEQPTATHALANCQPLHAYWKYHGVTTLPKRKFVNAGLLSGKAKALKVYFDWAIQNDFKDDQLALGNYLNAFPQHIAADHDASMLHTTNFALNAGVKDIHRQKHDAPTFAELFGRGAFFLHLSGANNPGQKIIFEFVRMMLDAGACDTTIGKPYKYAEPKWNEIF